MTGISNSLARCFNAKTLRAAGKAASRTASPSSNSRSLMKSISKRAAPDLSGAFPCRSAWMIGTAVSLPVHNLAAVGMQDLTSDVTCIVGSKEYEARGNFGRLTGTTERDIGAEGLNLFGL